MMDQRGSRRDAWDARLEHRSDVGQLTRAMAVIVRDVQRALRVGLVTDGRIVEERLLRDGTITVGDDDRCTFVIGVAAGQFPMFAKKRGGYRLRFTEAMSGRVGLGNTVYELAQLRERARRRTISGVECWELALDEDARGRVTLGDAVFLFQLVEVLPAAARAQLPTAVRARLADDIDWTTTIVAAFSFLLHFGAVGATYSDWMDGVVDDEIQVSQMLESVRALPSPPPVEEPAAPPIAPAHTGVATTPSSSPGTSRGPAGPRAPGAPGSMSDKAAVALMGELARHDLSVLGVLNSGQSATEGVLRRGDVPTSLLEQAAADAAGAGRRSGGLDMSQRTSTLPRGSARFDQIGNLERAAPTGTGSSAPRQGPRAGVQVDPAPPTGCDVPGAPAVVASLAGGFRACYQRGITQEDPTMSGSMRITARIGPNGEVMSASVGSVTGLSSTVSSCLANRVRTAQFSAPSCGGATLVIPIRLYPQ